MKCIIETIILCGNQVLALRGHNKEDGIFSRLLHYRSRDNSILREHLPKSELKHKYTSPDIQNEIIQICGEIFRAISHPQKGNSHYRLVGGHNIRDLQLGSRRYKDHVPQRNSEMEDKVRMPLNT